MINSSTENDTAEHDDDVSGTFVDRAAAEKQTLFDSRAIVGKYYDKDTLCAENELNKFRKKLNSMRTANFVPKDRSPFRRRQTDADDNGAETVANVQPSLHRTFASILNKESSAFVLPSAENAVDDGEYPKWQVNYIELEHIIGPFTTADPLRAPSSLMTAQHRRYRHMSVISDNQTSSAAVKTRCTPAKPAENPEKLRNATAVDDRTKDHCLPPRNKKPLADSGKTTTRQQQQLQPTDAGQKAAKNAKLWLRDAKKGPLVTAKTTKIDRTGKQQMRNH